MLIPGIVASIALAGCQASAGPAGARSELTAALPPEVELAQGRPVRAGATSSASRPDNQPPAVRAMAHYAAGVEFTFDGFWAEALAEFDQARALDPQDPRIALKMAECLDQLERGKEALAQYERAGALAPNDFTIQFALGNTYDRLERLLPAIRAFQQALAAPNALKASPEYAVAVWRLASLAVRTNQTSLGIEEYTRLLELIRRPQSGYYLDRRLWALCNHPELVCEQLGGLHLRLDDLAAAIKVFELGKEYAPDSPTILYRLGEAYLRHKDYDKALTEADRLVALSNNDPDAVDLLVRTAVEMKKPEEAIKRLEARLTAAPENLVLRFYLGSTYRETGRYPQAEQLLRACAEATPNALVYGELAATLRQAKHLDSALDALADAVDKDAVGPRVLAELDLAAKDLRTDTPTAMTWTAAAKKKTTDRGAQFVLGAVLADRRDYPAAAEALKRAVALGPAFIWAYVQLAEVYTRQKQYAEAVKVYRQAQAQGFAKNVLVYRMIAHLQERLNELPEALKSVDEALKLDSGDTRTLYLKANLFDRMGKEAEAEKTYRDILATEPADGEANNALAYFYATRQKQLDQARKLIDRALKKEPANGAYLDTLGWVLYQQGQYAEALKALQSAAEAIKKGIAPEGDPVILDHLGAAYEKLKQYPEARRAYEQALELNERDPSTELDPAKVKEKLERLPK